MYYIRLHHYFAKLFCCTALLLAACSVRSNDNPHSLASERKGASSWSIETISESPYVYRISHESAPMRFYFYTVIQNCGAKLSPPKAVSTRQLLIGLSNIRVEQQAEIDIANRTFLRSQVQAQLEEQSLQLVVYTEQNMECISDYAFWWRDSKENPQETLTNLEQFMLKQIG